MRHKSITYILLVLFNFVSAQAAEIELTCAKDVLEDYYSFLDGRNPVEIIDYHGKNSRRDVVEVILIQQALHFGGFSGKVKFQPREYGYYKALQRVSSGEAVSNCATVWAKDALSKNYNLDVSQVMIPPEKFEAGLFVNEYYYDNIKIKSRVDISKYKAACNVGWRPDISALREIGARCVYFERWSDMLTAVFSGRADFLLAPFQSNPDGMLMADGHRLYPVKGVKVHLPEERRYPISKTHPDAIAFKMALKKGLEVMEQKGLIDKAYSQSGFYNQNVKNWLVLNKP